jgi:hypothetical protein
MLGKFVLWFSASMFIAYGLVCLIWPVYAWIGVHIEPFVLGLPLSFAWVLGWVVLTFAVLLAYHVTGDDHGEAD